MCVLYDYLALFFVSALYDHEHVCMHVRFRRSRTDVRFRSSRTDVRFRRSRTVHVVNVGRGGSTGGASALRSNGFHDLRFESRPEHKKKL